MPKRSSKPKRPRDINKLVVGIVKATSEGKPGPSSKSTHQGDVNVQAKRIVDIATGEAERRKPK
jgi:hypothetical protein